MASARPGSGTPMTFNILSPAVSSSFGTLTLLQAILFVMSLMPARNSNYLAFLKIYNHNEIIP